MRSFSRLGRGAARFPLALGVAASIVAMAASTAQAEPVPNPWKANYHDFGTVSGSHTFVFTNVYTLSLMGQPAPFGHAEFSVTGNTCGAPVAPGGTCKVMVHYAADGQPIADGLQMHFTAPSGGPVATPPVQLFAGGVQYVRTGHRSGVFTFPTSTPTSGRTPGPGVPPFPAETVTIQYFGVPAILKQDFQPSMTAPFTVLRNGCLAAGTGACRVVLKFAPVNAGQYVANFQMGFENAQTGASLPTQDVTLVGNAVAGG
jgi:hypothetical protein